MRMGRVIEVFKITRCSPTPKCSLMHIGNQNGLAPSFMLNKQLSNGRELEPGAVDPYASRGLLPFFITGEKVGEMEKLCLGKDSKVSILQNFFLFFFNGGFIFKEDDSFHLVVLKYGDLDFRSHFESFGEAQVALLEFFGEKEEEVLRYIKPVWSGFSHPQELSLSPSLQSVLEYVLEVVHC